MDVSIYKSLPERLSDVLPDNSTLYEHIRLSSALYGVCRRMLQLAVVTTEAFTLASEEVKLAIRKIRPNHIIDTISYL